MNIFKNILKPTRFLAIFILLLVGFFSLATAKPALAAKATCGTVVNTCEVGSLQKGGKNLSPVYDYWQCKVSSSDIANCNNNVCGNKVIDASRGEECDGSIPAGKTCENYNGIDSPDCQLKCSPVCKIDATQCAKDICQSSCGNNKIEGWEECDGTAPITKTCEQYGPNYFGGNLLICNPQCNLRADNCMTCGNGKIETYNGVKEVCDGSDFGGKTCKDYGFTSGKLICKKELDESKNCRTIDTSQCTNGELACGNNKIDWHCSNNILMPCVTDAICGVGNTCVTNEECDGSAINQKLDTNKNGEINCDDFSCVGYGLKCGSNCLFDKSVCDCKKGGCTDGQTSSWGASGEVTKSCCGSVAGTFVNELYDGTSGLCLNLNSIVKGSFTHVNNTGTDNGLGGADYVNRYAVKGWSWKCKSPSTGLVTDCSATKTPQCASGIATKNDTCVSTMNHKNSDAYNAAYAAREKQNINPLCDGGLYAPDNGRCLSSRPDWYDLNKRYTCSNTSDTGEKQEVTCVAGWSGPSVCGKLNNYEFVAGKTNNCAEDGTIKSYYGLISEDNYGQFCAPGSKIVLNSKAYYTGDTLDNALAHRESNPYWGNGNDRAKYKWYSWQCQSQDAYGKYGEIVDCKTTLNDSGCIAKDPMCGPATKMSFAYYEQGQNPGPTKGFCAYGKLGGSAYFDDYKVHFSTVKGMPVWDWLCLDGDGFINKNNNPKSAVFCSVAASVYCGKAAGGNFSSDLDVRKAGPCAGTGPGALVNNEIRANGNNWEWTCADLTNPTITVDCKASANKCGYADGRSYLTSTFTAQTVKNNPKFLCPDSSYPVVSLLQYDAKDGNYKWNWKCGANNCSATELACGTANTGTYFKSEFDSNSKKSANFLCTNGFGKDVDMIYTPDYSGDGLGTPGVYDPGHFWSCEGDEVKAGAAKDNLASQGGCSAREYDCGYFDGYSAHESLPDYWGSGFTVATDIFESYKKDATKKDAFCANGSVPVFDDNILWQSAYPELKDMYSAWYCVHPSDVNKADSKRNVICQITHPKCGEATTPDKAFYRQTLENHINKGDKYLCAYAAPEIGADADKVYVQMSGTGGTGSAYDRTEQFFNLTVPFEKKWYDSLSVLTKNLPYADKQYYKDTKTSNIKTLNWYVDYNRGNLYWYCNGSSGLAKYGISETKNAELCKANRQGCTVEGFPPSGAVHSLATIQSYVDSKTAPCEVTGKNFTTALSYTKRNITNYLSSDFLLHGRLTYSYKAKWSCLDSEKQAGYWDCGANWTEGK